MWWFWPRTDPSLCHLEGAHPTGTWMSSPASRLWESPLLLLKPPCVEYFVLAATPPLPEACSGLPPPGLLGSLSTLLCWAPPFPAPQGLVPTSSISRRLSHRENPSPWDAAHPLPPFHPIQGRHPPCPSPDSSLCALDWFSTRRIWETLLSASLSALSWLCCPLAGSLQPWPSHPVLPYPPRPLHPAPALPSLVSLPWPLSSHSIYRQQILFCVVTNPRLPLPSEAVLTLQRPRDCLLVTCDDSPNAPAFLPNMLHLLWCWESPVLRGAPPSSGAGESSPRGSPSILWARDQWIPSSHEGEVVRLCCWHPVEEDFPGKAFNLCNPGSFWQRGKSGGGFHSAVRSTSVKVSHPMAPPQAVRLGVIPHTAKSFHLPDADVVTVLHVERRKKIPFTHDFISCLVDSMQYCLSPEDCSSHSPVVYPWQSPCFFYSFFSEEVSYLSSKWIFSGVCTRNGHSSWPVADLLILKFLEVPGRCPEAGFSFCLHRFPEAAWWGRGHFNLPLHFSSRFIAMKKVSIYDSSCRPSLCFVREGDGEKEREKPLLEWVSLGEAKLLLAETSWVH